MFTFRVLGRLVTIQAATYVLPVYQKVETSGWTSKPGDEESESAGQNSTITSHRLLIPVFKVIVLNEKDAKLDTELFFPTEEDTK